MFLMELWWLWLILSATLIAYSAWSARRHSDAVIERVAETGSDEVIDDLPPQVKVTFIAGVVFAITFMLSIVGWVLWYIASFIPVGVQALGSMMNI